MPDDLIFAFNMLCIGGGTILLVLVACGVWDD